MHFLKVVLIFSTVAIQAQATSLELEASQSSQTKTYEISGSGEFNKPKDAEANTYGWSLSADRSRSDTTNSSGSAITDNTTDLAAGLGVEMPSRFRSGASFNYSTTPEENLKSSGFTVSAGYTYNFDDQSTGPEATKPVMTTGDPSDMQESREASPSGSEFSPYLAADLNYESLDYVQTFEAKAPRLSQGPSKPTSGKNTINQKFTQITVKLKPYRWVRFKVSYTKYSYSRDVSEFLQFLDSHDLLGKVSSGFSTALSGFYDNTILVGATLFPSSDWEIAATRSTSKVISDDSLSTTDKLAVYWNFAEAWRLGAGASVSKSNTAGSAASTQSSLSVGYEF